MKKIHTVILKSIVFYCKNILTGSLHQVNGVSWPSGYGVTEETGNC